MKARMLGALICAGLLAPSRSMAALYSGSLSAHGGGLTGSAAWDSSSTTFSWEVDWTGSIWHYKYTFLVPSKNISHWILEVSDDFDVDDMINPTPGVAEWGQNFNRDQGNAQPGMPSQFDTGIKVTPNSGTSSVFEFDSPRAPVWKDFYAKDGTDGGVAVTLWNNGNLFQATATDADANDPTDAPANGSVAFHVLAPDSVEIGPQEVVPEPGTLALLCGGLLAAARRRRRA